MTPRERTVTSGLSTRFCSLIVVGVVEPVEAADLVRAVVGTVARADAAVVDLLVQPLVAVDRGQHRADRLAGGVAAVLAEHRLMGHLHVAAPAAGVVAIDAEPVHLALPPHLVLADHGDVVLRLAGDDAGGAAGAGVEVDGHAPAAARSRGGRRARGRRAVSAWARRAACCRQRGQRGFLDDRPALLAGRSQVGGHGERVADSACRPAGVCCPVLVSPTRRRAVAEACRRPRPAAGRRSGPPGRCRRRSAGPPARAGRCRRSAR